MIGDLVFPITHKPRATKKEILDSKRKRVHLKLFSTPKYQYLNEEIHKYFKSVLFLVSGCNVLTFGLKEGLCSKFSHELVKKIDVKTQLKTNENCA